LSVHMSIDEFCQHFIDPQNCEIGDANQTLLCAVSLVSCITSLIISNDMKRISNMGQLIVPSAFPCLIGYPESSCSFSNSWGSSGNSVIPSYPTHFCLQKSVHSEMWTDTCTSRVTWHRSMPPPPASLTREDEYVPRISCNPLVQVVLPQALSALHHH
jgi:hypothetical protein